MKRFGAFLAVFTLSVMILWTGIGMAFVRCNHSGAQHLGFVAESHCCESHCCESNDVAVGNNQIDSGCMSQLFAKITDLTIDNVNIHCFDAVQCVIISDLLVHFSEKQNVLNHRTIQKFYPPPRLYLTLINVLII